MNCKAAMNLGLLDEARKLALDARRESKSQGDRQGVITGTYYLGEVSRRMGRLATARRHLGNVLAHKTSFISGSRLVTACALEALAKTYISTQRWRAEKYMREAELQFRALGLRHNANQCKAAVELLAAHSTEDGLGLAA